jgi:hypothetical protein
LPPSAEVPLIWVPALTSRFHRKSTKIGGTGVWSRGAQMRGGSIFAAFFASRSGGALPPSAEAPLIWAPALTGRFRRKSTEIGGTGAWSRGAQMLVGSDIICHKTLNLESPWESLAVKVRMSTQFTGSHLPHRLMSSFPDLPRSQETTTMIMGREKDY